MSLPLLKCNLKTLAIMTFVVVWIGKSKRQVKIQIGLNFILT